MTKFMKSNNRLTQKIKQARGERRKLFCAYITLGFPNLSTTEKLLAGFDSVGVDILELGFPFSDPLADGPTIQAASERALKHSITIDIARSIVAKARKRGVTMPIIFFSYVNPILQYGAKRFAEGIRRDGFDGVIIPDLPPDEDPALVDAIKRAGLSFVNLVAPTSSNERMKFLARKSKDFIYYVSRCGVTGERKQFEQGMDQNIRRLRKFSKNPILIGFGVSSPEQAKAASQVSDGVVVGSAFISAIRKARGGTASVVKLAKKFSRAVHGRPSLPGPHKLMRRGVVYDARQINGRGEPRPYN